jgi:hypothetical protein
MFSELRGSELAGFASTVERLIGRLEATDAEGRSAFMEATRPEEG